MSADQNTQVPQHAPTEALSQRPRLQEAKQPRTPERDTAQLRDRSPASQRKRFNPRLIQGPTCDAQKSPLLVPLAERQAELQPGSKSSSGLGREGGRRGHEEWPTPAKTLLGAHIQNHIQMENGGITAYESPIPQVKQLPGKVGSDRADQQQYQMIESQKNRAGHDTVNNPEDLREANPSLKSAPLHKGAAPGHHTDNATFTDQGSTTVGATRNWVHHTPKMGERACEEDLDTGRTNQYSSSAHQQQHFYPQQQAQPYGPPAPHPYYPSHYYYPAAGHYPPPEYAAVSSQGYPLQMMSPQRSAYQAPPYYYDHPAAAYPSHGHYTGYYPTAGGPMPTYPDYKHRSSAKGTPCRDPRYSAYWADQEYMPGPYMYPTHQHPYVFDGSPGHMIPPVMQSPHQRHHSVNASSTKKKRPSTEHKHHRSGDRQSDMAEPSSRARASHIHPRQLNFNDDEQSVEEDEDEDETPHNQIKFEDVDATDQQNRSSSDDVEDNDNDDQIQQEQAPKIKLNSARKSCQKFETPQGITETTTKNRTDCSSVQVIVERKLGLQSNSSDSKLNRKEQQMRQQQNDYAVRENHIVSIRSQPVTKRHQPLKDEDTDGNLDNFNAQQLSCESPQMASNKSKVTLQRQEDYGARIKNVQIEQPDGQSGADDSQIQEVSSATVRKSLITPVPGRRGYMFDEANGQMVRVIRKRKRKTQCQLEELANAFEENHFWSKERLQQIAATTHLTEAQVYKWGWDQKRKKFGVDEAERMRKYENILDQQNAAKKQQALKQYAARSPTTTTAQRSQVESYPQQQQLQKAATAESGDLSQHTTKIQKHLHASAEVATKMDEFGSTTVCPFPDMVSRVQSTVQKPNGGHLQNDNLQKSAATKATTIRASCQSSHETPRISKQTSKGYHQAEVMSEDDFATSEKCTPQNSTQLLDEDLAVESVGQRRQLKIQDKERKKIKQIQNQIGEMQQEVQLETKSKGGAMRQTRKQTAGLREASQSQVEGRTTRPQRRGQPPRGNKSALGGD